MPREKIKFAMRIKPETQELVREWYSRDNCQSQNEFIEKAIHYYVEHLSAQSSTSFLPSALVSALRATIQASENRIARLLFKLTVEISMMMYGRRGWRSTPAGWMTCDGGVCRRSKR